MEAYSQRRTCLNLYIGMIQEGLAVARIARDDGSSSTNFSPAVTQLRGTHFSVTHFIPSLRTSVTQILLRVLYVGSIRTMWRRFRPMW